MTESPVEWSRPAYAGWATLEDARANWADADDLEDDDLTSLLQAAYEQCEAFAPAVTGTLVPESYVLAQVMQARAIYRSTQSGRDDQIGVDGLTVTVFPMDWTVKNLLRPKRGRYLVR